MAIPQSVIPPLPGLGVVSAFHGTATAPVTKVESTVFELHFVGELESGVSFYSVTEDEGLFVDFVVRAGEEWIPFAKHEGYTGQTQAAYADAEGTHCFNHPLDLHYVSASMIGWPRLHVQILKLNEAGCVKTVSFGSVALPASPGHSELVCRTWAPIGDVAHDEALAAHRIGGPPALTEELCQELFEAGHPEKRTQMMSKTSGSICISLDTIFRNASAQGILLKGGR